MITFFVYGKKYYRNQPDDVDIVHGYILFSMDRPGNFIKKPARECTGNEIFAELLYHCGLEDKIDQILAHSYVSIAACLHHEPVHAPPDRRPAQGHP